MNVSSSIDNSGSIKLLQITDTHLFEPDDGALLGVNTADSFAAVVKDVQDKRVKFDAILATGDISQDHSQESYQRFTQGIAPLAKPCFWLPGNHDFKPHMGNMLPSTQIHSQHEILVGEHWLVVMLDSQVEGVPHGRLSQEQLTLLDKALTAHPDRWALIVLHHHPVLVNSEWLDQHTLKDSDKFWQVVAKHQRVQAVLCGHIHQELDVKHQGVRVLATPSTCAQFKPKSNEFSVDRRSPGWRELELQPDGQITTQVQRLANGRYLPDYNANGY